MPKRPSKSPTTFAERRKNSKRVRLRTNIQTPVLWHGPQTFGPLGGISQSMLSGYFRYRERFRIAHIEGLSTPSDFSVPIEFGQMWHIAEEHLAEHGEIDFTRTREYAINLAKKYRNHQHQVNRWYNIVRTQFPIYVKYWESDRDVLIRKPLFQEEVFNLKYTLPSGRFIYMKGKFDSVDFIGNDIFLQENKTKSRIDEFQLNKQLLFDLQVMYYLIALRIRMPKEKIAGVRYNVIVRATSSGSKGSISQRKARGKTPAETMEHYLGRVKEIIEGDPGYFFKRWKVYVSDSDISKFEKTCLHPIMENLLDDYEWWSHCHEAGSSPFDYQHRSSKFPEHKNRHYRIPYGIYDYRQNGYSDEIDSYIDSGSTVGLSRSQGMFPELQEE